MPKGYRSVHQLLPHADIKHKTTIDQYYLSRHCPICDALTVRGLCAACKRDKQKSALVLSSRSVPLTAACVWLFAMGSFVLGADIVLSCIYE